jgi:hypothetical protein
MKHVATVGLGIILFATRVFATESAIYSPSEAPTVKEKRPLRKRCL